MISVTEAEKIIQAELRDYGTEQVHLQQAINRVLAEDILADRDLPPYDRVTMDGIAMSFNAFEKGTRAFHIIGTQAAGDKPYTINNEDDCIEIMTGASLPNGTDTIIRYEDLSTSEGRATINIDTIRKGQNIHYKGSDKKAGTVLAKKGALITPAVINTAASVGKANILVAKLPKVAILSTGNELVDIDDTPNDFEIRRSNSYTIAALLKEHHIQADLLHVDDEQEVIKTTLTECLKNYDVLLLSGGVSMGKYDYLPIAFERLGVQQQFHKVKQRPGKPLWFGTGKDGQVVFAFPGNSVSTFMCMYRYFLPWLQKSIGNTMCQPLYAVLDSDYTFKHELQYFLQVTLHSNEEGKLLATPFEGNGSGDFTNLLDTQAFMELPEKQTNFKKGEVYKIWPYKPLA